MAAAPTRLRCDFRENPLGIDNLRPQLSWLPNDPRPAEIQTAWQILAASEPGRLNEVDADLWDSGRVSASGQVQVHYGGAALVSRQRIWWAVQSFDSDGLPSGFSRPAFFEMGLLQSSDWLGRWIGATYMGSRSIAAPVPMLVRDFLLAAMPKRARLYIAAAGYCRGEINGQTLGMGANSPTASDYRTRVRYRTLDVTALLTRGHNRLGLLLADGTFAGNIVRGHQRQQFGERPMLLAQLEVVSADGRLQRFTSDAQWRFRPSGWLVSDPILGEHFDARQQAPFWSRATLQTSDQPGWQAVRCYPAPSGALAADIAPALVVQRRRVPVQPPSLVLDEWQQSSWRYEFAEPVYGSLEIKAQLESGQRLLADYHLELPGLRSPAADSCTSSGGVYRHESLSVLRRFQAVTLSGDLDQAQLPGVTALELSSVGDLGLRLDTDSQPLAHWHRTLVSDLQAGCVAQPHTGQDLEAGLSATADLAGILDLLGRCQGTAPLLRSWAQDLMDAEARRGNLPRVVPTVPGEPMLHEAGSTEALALTIWSLYRNFGDLRMVDVAYSAVSRLLRVMSETAPDHIRWYSVPALEAALPADLVGTAWFYQGAKLAAEMAGVLGKTADQTHFALLAEDIRSAFRRRFVTAEGAVVSRTQSALCLALGGGLLDLQERPMAIAGLVASVRQEGLRVQTGQLPLLLQILSRNGHLPLALALLSTESGCAQFTDHYGRTMVAAGALEWVYADLLGLRLPANADLASGAFRQLLIEPCLPLGAEFTDALGWTRIAGSCQTIRGEVSCGWQLVEDGLVLTVELPVDTTAQLQLPGRASELLSSGPHERLLLRSELPDDGIPKLLDARVDSPRRESLHYPRAS